MSGLIILDLNGVLSLSGKRRLEITKYAIDFVKSLQRKYSVAIWTSTTFKNANPAIEYCFKNLKPPLFEWYRDKTDPDYHNELNPYATIKNISKVREYFPLYQNILIVDDSASKIRFNNPEESLVIEKSEKIDFQSFYENLEYNIDCKMKLLSLK